MTTTTRTLRTDGELHFNGSVDPEQGQLLGPDLDGRLWEVTGSVYDAETDRTTVYAQVSAAGFLANLQARLEGAR